MQDIIPKPHRISPYIAQRPYGLLIEPTLILLQQPNQRLNSILVNEHLALGSGAGCDIGDYPACLEPDLRVLLGVDERYQRRQYPAIDDDLHGLLVLVLRYYLPQSDDGLVLYNRIWMHDVIDRGWQLLFRIVLLQCSVISSSVL